MKKIIISIIVIILAAGVYYAHDFYQRIYENNVNLPSGEKKSLYVYSDYSTDDVISEISKLKLLKDTEGFKWLADFKKLDAKPGHYIIRSGMNNNQIINMLRSGLQKPVKVTFNNIRTIYDLAGAVGKQIEADSADIANLLADKNYLQNIKQSPQTIASLFIPDTYEFYWNTDAEGFVKKMQKAHDKYWTAERKQKAEKIGLNPTEVATLASIVQAEQSNHNDEKPIIAGLYINRLKKRMFLQSDPTLVFANGDFSIKRVLNEHKEIDSPYNTYKNIGLPPGPILFPEKSSLNAVLNYDKNNYLFMCAKDDFSGYHYFAKTNRQHNVYAQRYRRALNKRRIYK